MRIAGHLLCLALVASLAVGCGGSSHGERSRPRAQEGSSSATTSTAPPSSVVRTCDSYAIDASALRASGVACDQARGVMFAWQRADSCSMPTAASRNACAIRGYRCLGVATDRGIAVSCAAAGRSISFVAERD